MLHMFSLRPMHFNSNENLVPYEATFRERCNGQTACRFAAREIRRGSAEISSKEMVKGHFWGRVLNGTTWGEFKTHDFRIPNNHLAELFLSESCPKESG